jgi:protein-tyrosine phosphatase
MISRGEVMTVADRGNYLLLEPPLVGVPNYLEQLCFELQIAGITPLLAHPERTELYRQDPEIYQRLAERGCLIQVNAASIRGSEGRTTRNNSLSLLRDGIADVLASDAHNASSHPPVISNVRRDVSRAAEKDTFRQMTEVVPGKIIGGPQYETAPDDEIIG